MQLSFNFTIGCERKFVLTFKFHFPLMNKRACQVQLTFSTLSHYQMYTYLYVLLVIIMRTMTSLALVLWLLIYGPSVSHYWAWHLSNDWSIWCEFKLVLRNLAFRPEFQTVRGGYPQKKPNSKPNRISEPTWTIAVWFSLVWAYSCQLAAEK